MLDFRGIKREGDNSDTSHIFRTGLTRIRLHIGPTETKYHPLEIN